MSDEGSMASEHRVERRGYIEHRTGDEVAWQVVDGRKGESVEALVERTHHAMFARRGLMTRGSDTKSSFVIQERTVTPWQTVIIARTRENADG